MWFFLLFALTVAADYAELNAARLKWASVGSSDYSYEYKQGPCFCTEIAFEPKLVTVRNGRVESIVVISTGQPYDYSPGTIDDIFDSIEETLNSQKLYEVTYDTQLGHPIGDVKLDTEAYAYDGGTWWVISKLRLLANCAEKKNCFSCTSASCFWQDEAGCQSECNVADASCFKKATQCPAVFCTEDAKICPDGSYVGRNPDAGCEFFDCQTYVACTMEAKICDDGSSVGRGGPYCTFRLCPGEVFPYIGSHEKEIEVALASIDGFSNVMLVEVEVSGDIIFRVVVSNNIEGLLDAFKEEFANAISVGNERVTVTHFTLDAGKKRDTAWLVTLNVDEDKNSGVEVVKTSLMMAIFIGWLWI